MPSRPFTWNDVVEKFDQLTADHIGSPAFTPTDSTGEAVTPSAAAPGHLTRYAGAP
jgi:hypothetical protein